MSYFNKHFQFTPQAIADAVKWKQDSKLVNPLKQWFPLVEVKGGIVYVDGKKPVTTDKERDEIIKRFYTDPSTGLVGRDKLHERILREYIGIPRRYIMDWLKKQEDYQLRQPVPRKHVVHPIVISNPHKHLQMDIIDLQKYADENKGMKYALNIIDLFTKKLWSYPLQSKEAKEVASKVGALFASGVRTSVLQSDNGGEFKNAEMKQVCDRWGVKQIFSTPYTPTSQGAVERVNRTLKDMLYRYFIMTNSVQWITVWPQLIANYNDSIQRVVKATPNAVAAGNIEVKVVRERIQHEAAKHKRPDPQIQEGQLVRVASRAIDPNASGNKFYKPMERWSRHIYTVNRVYNPQVAWGAPRYLIGGKLYGGYDLQKVVRPAPPPVVLPPGLDVRILPIQPMAALANLPRIPVGGAYVYQM